MADLPRNYLEFRERHQDVWKALDELAETVAGSGPLDRRTRELVKLGMAAAAGSESAVESHALRGLDAGATEDEVEHVLLLAITTLGFPRAMAARAWAHRALASRRQA